MVYIQQDTLRSFQNTRKQFAYPFFPGFMYIVLTLVKCRPGYGFTFQGLFLLTSACVQPQQTVYKGSEASARLNPASAHGSAAAYK